MAAYKGSVELISGITQKNGGKFPLVDAGAVQYDDNGRSVKDVLRDLEDGTDSAITEAEIDALFS